MKYLPTSLYLTCKPVRRPCPWGDGCIVTENFRGPWAHRSHYEIRLPAGVQVSRGTVSTQGFADTVDIVPPEAREGTWDPAPGRRAGALGDSVDVRVPLIPYTLHRQKAREGTCGGWGAELKPWAILVWK